MAFTPTDTVATYSGNGPAGSGLDQYLSGISGKRAALNTSQAGQQSDFLGRYTGAINGQETSSAMADRIGGKLGLPELQKNATTLNTTLANIPYTYGAATKGFDVNNNQLNRIIGQKSSELTPVVNSTNNALSTAQGQLTSRMGYEQADQAKQLAPYQSEQSLLTDRLNRESAGFNTDAESELSSYLAKMNAGIQLSQAEQTRAENLAQSKLAYDQADKQFNSISASSKYATDSAHDSERTKALVALANSGKF